MGRIFVGMNTKSHTVTIPIEDYNELLKTKEFVGIVKIDKNNPLYKIIDNAVKYHSSQYKTTETGLGETELFYRVWVTKNALNVAEQEKKETLYLQVMLCLM